MSGSGTSIFASQQAPARAGRRRSAVGRSVCCLLLLSICATALAHTPHHVVDSLVISPDYRNDTTVYVLVHKYLLRSTQRGGNWQPLVNGIDTPHVLSDIAISPDFAADDALFVSSDGGGIFHSVDRGDSWQEFSAGLPHGRFGLLRVASIGNSRWLFAAGAARGLYYSPLDRAEWRRSISDDIQISAIAGGDEPNTDVLMAGDSAGGLWRSDGDPASWQRIAKLDEADAITAFGRVENGWLVGTASMGLVHIRDEDSRPTVISSDWSPVTEDCRGRPLEAPRDDSHVRDIEVSADGRRILVTTWYRALYVSDDAGATWNLRSDGLRCDIQADASAFSTPYFRDVEAGAGSAEFTGPGTAISEDWFVAAFEGLYRTSDAGETWTPLETMPVRLIRGLGVSAQFDGGHHLVVTTYGGGAYLGSDSGQSWRPINHGLVTTRLADADFPPDDGEDHQIFATSDEHLLVFDQTDSRWDARSVVYRGWRRRIGGGLENYLGFSPAFGKDLFLDRNERHGVWPMHIALSPEFARDRALFLGFRRHGIWESYDAGDSWDRDWAGPRDYVTDLAVSPDFGQDRTVIAGIRGAGIYITRDGGESWRTANTGFDNFGDYVATVSPNHYVDPPLTRALTDVVIAFSPRIAVDDTVFAGTAAGLFRSTDAGNTWTRLPILPPGVDTVVLAVATSPQINDGYRVLVSVKGRGLFQSGDGGQNFRPLGESLISSNVDCTRIAFSPAYATDGTIYAGSDWELWISASSGISWKKLRLPVRYEDRRGGGGGPGPVWFHGEWRREAGDEFSASTQTLSDEAGAYATLVFSGTAFSWHGELGPDGGKARVVLDGVVIGYPNLYREQPSPSAEIFSASGLEDAPHELRIEILEPDAADVRGSRVTVDFFDVESRP